jgi:hypothetical protein
MARNREIRLNYVGAFLGLPTSSATTFRITRTRHSPATAFMQLRESTKRAIMTHPNHEQKPRDWTQMPAYFQPQQSSLNKDASLQYGMSTHANERELLAVVEAPRSGATDSRLHRRILLSPPLNNYGWVLGNATLRPRLYP